VPVWGIVAGSVVVALLAGAATYAATRSNTEPAPTTPSAATTTSTAPGAVDGYKITAGAGGTATAVDGHTPIGYAATCAGAVEAATNYYTAVGDGPFQERFTAAGFAALLDQLNAGLDDSPMSSLKQDFAKTRAEANEGSTPFPNPQSYPEWGAFRVESCTKGSTAEIDVDGFFEDSIVPGKAQTDPRHVTVSWSGGDWRLADIKDLANSPSDSVPGYPAAPVPASVREEMIAQGGPGWTEYTNAPR
jgi:hypothetical protein